ncbi:MAG: alpha/beta hydrolase [Actinomycetota bacterium]|nr:alpha/beta hydrolase [Actinomycetota bacterium]
MAGFVLIHGTTQSPEGWGRLAVALEAQGHHTTTVDLADHPARDADDYAMVVRDQLPRHLVDPILVGHSAGALVLPATARLLSASHQVWLAATIPDGRRSLLEEMTTAATEMFNPEWLGQDATSDPVLATYFLFHDCDLRTLRWALKTVRFFDPTALYDHPIALAPEIPSTSVVATLDRTLRPEWSRRQSARRLGADIIEIRTGHCPHVSRPAELAAALIRLSARR